MAGRPPDALRYPTDHLLAVIDEPAVARRAADDLVAAGFAPLDVTILDRDGAGAGLGELGRRPGLAIRLLRAVQFTTMDQMPDLRLYEAAVTAGRAVVAVHVRDRAALGRARDILEAAGAHFLNHYGRFTTEELTRWRGPELDLPGYLRR